MNENFWINQMKSEGQRQFTEGYSTTKGCSLPNVHQKNELDINNWRNVVFPEPKTKKL